MYKVKCVLFYEKYFNNFISKFNLILQNHGGFEGLTDFSCHQVRKALEKM